MSGSRKRISGLLRRASRGLILTTDQGEIWVIETDDEVADLLGYRVVVEGTAAGLDRLKTDWIGASE